MMVALVVASSAASVPALHFTEWHFTRRNMFVVIPVEPFWVLVFDFTILGHHFLVLVLVVRRDERPYFR